MTREGRILTATAIAGCVAICVFLVMVAAVRKRDRVDECGVNLRHLSMALASPQDERWDTQPAGRRFWAEYPRWPVRGTYPLTPTVLVCPTRGGKAGQDIDYRGPAKSLRLLGPEDAVACDQQGNHGTGRHNVLLKDGRILQFELRDAGWARAMATTGD